MDSSLHHASNLVGEDDSSTATVNSPTDNTAFHQGNEGLERQESEVLSSQYHHIKATLYPKGILPPPLIFEPILEHKQTFIILHGRGSFAARLAPSLVGMRSSPSHREGEGEGEGEGKTLQESFPHAKLIFLTAARSKATIYGKCLTHQWFDNWHLEEYTRRQELMGNGLRRSVEYVLGVLKEEIKVVGEGNVVLWGLSQGCATVLSTVLAWDGVGNGEGKGEGEEKGGSEGSRLAAVVGMCGWLPYSNVIQDLCQLRDGGDDVFGGKEKEVNDDPFARSDDGEDEEDPFARSDNEDGDDNKNLDDSNGGGISSKSSDRATQALSYLWEEIDMSPPQSATYKKIPIFLGHGTEDEKVSIQLGREAKKCLEILGVEEVRMEEYEGLGHWFSPEMLGDIFEFLREKLGTSNSEEG